MQPSSVPAGLKVNPSVSCPGLQLDQGIQNHPKLDPTKAWTLYLSFHLSVAIAPAAYVSIYVYIIHIYICTDACMYSEYIHTYM